MKLSTTLATAALLAVSAWAGAPGAPGLAAAPALPLFQAACPTPAPAVATPKDPWKHGPAEYNDFVAASGATDNAKKAQLAAAFVQKYPDSFYKMQALQVEMTGQAGTPSQHEQAVATAQSIITSGSAESNSLLAAYTIIAFLDPQLVQQNDPDMTSKMAALQQAATCGQQLLGNTPANVQAQYAPVFTKAQGFAQLNTKDYDGAITTLTKAAQQDPKDPLPYYWMGIAEVTKNTPDVSSGLFYLAKASVLSPNTTAFKDYLTKVYTEYHGSADGLADVITTATNNSAPPAGYRIASKVDLENAANMANYEALVEKQKNELPPEDTFAGVEARLKKPDLAAAEWKKTKGQGLELQGTVIAVTAKSVDLSVINPDNNPNPAADVRLVLAAPFTATKRPKVGEQVTFDGVPDAFKPNPPDPSAPFLLTMNQGSVKGYSPEAKPGPGGAGGR